MVSDFMATPTKNVKKIYRKYFKVYENLLLLEGHSKEMSFLKS